jgi:membrane protease YdiL (CAAX protease family)
MGAALAALGLSLAPLVQALLFRLQPRRRVFFARWGFSHVLGAVLAASVTYLVGEALLPASAPFDGPLRDLILPQFALLGALGVAVWAARVKQPESWRALGFPRSTRGEDAGERGRSALLSLGALAGSLPLIVGLSLLWPAVLELLGAGGDAGAIADWPELGGGALVAAYVLALAVAPLLEETFFRGFLQPLFVQNFSEVGGVLLVALLFASVHGVGPFLPLFAVGLVLGAIKLKTQRVWPCILAHAAYNAVVLGISAA